MKVSDPVAAEFNLNTKMFLLSKKDLWLSDGSMGFGEGTDVAFIEGKFNFTLYVLQNWNQAAFNYD